jgi:hypothetical protein
MSFDPGDGPGIAPPVEVLVAVAAVAASRREVVVEAAPVAAVAASRREAREKT